MRRYATSVCGVKVVPGEPVLIEPFLIEPFLIEPFLIEPFLIEPKVVPGEPVFHLKKVSSWLVVKTPPHLRQPLVSFCMEQVRQPLLRLFWSSRRRCS